jgi:hypothetical protein
MNPNHYALRALPIEQLINIEAKGSQLLSDMERLMTLDTIGGSARRAEGTECAFPKSGRDKNAKRLIFFPKPVVAPSEGDVTEIIARILRAKPVDSTSARAIKRAAGRAN